VNVLLISEARIANLCIGRFLMGSLMAVNMTLTGPFLRDSGIGLPDLKQFSVFTGILLGIFTGYFLPSFALQK
jgi:hypothetical protein